MIKITIESVVDQKSRLIKQFLVLKRSHSVDLVICKESFAGVCFDFLVVILPCDEKQHFSLKVIFEWFFKEISQFFVHRLSLALPRFPGHRVTLVDSVLLLKCEI